MERRFWRRFWKGIGPAAAICLLRITAGGGERVEPLAHFRNFAQQAGGLQGWTSWSPLEQIKPHFGVDKTAGRAGQGALEIKGSDNPAAWGEWRRRVDGIVGGR